MSRLRGALVLSVLLLAVVLAGVYVGRRAIAEYAAHMILSSEGLSDTRLTVAEIGWGETVAVDVALPAAGITAGAVRFVYDPLELVKGTLDEVKIAGLRIDASADWQERLALLLDRGSAGASGGTAADGGSHFIIRKVRFDDAQFNLPPSEPGLVTVDGALGFGGRGSESELRIGIDLGYATGRLRLSSDTVGEGASISVEGSGRAELARALAGRLEEAELIGGEATMTVGGTLRFPDGEKWFGALIDNLSLAGELTLFGAAIRDGTTVSGNLGWALDGRDDALTLTLPRPTQLVLSGLPPEVLAVAYVPSISATPVSITLSAPRPLATWRSGDDGGALEFDADMSLAAGRAVVEINARASTTHDAAGRMRGPAAFALEIRGGGADLSGPLGDGWLDRFVVQAQGMVTSDGTVSFGGPIAAELVDLNLSGLKTGAAVMDGQIRGSWTRTGWSVSAAPGLALSLEEPATLGQLNLTGPARLTFERLEAGEAGGGLQLELAAAAQDLWGTISDTTFTGAGGRLRLALDGDMRGEVELEGGEALLPNLSLAISEVSARLPLSGVEEAPAALAASVRDSARRPRFAPLTLSLSGKQTTDTVTLLGTIAVAKGVVSLPLKVTVDRAAGTGEAAVGPGRINFRRKGLQPTALSPLLAGVSNAEGSVRINGTVVSAKAGAPSIRLAIRFEDLSARTETVDFEGLGGTLNLSSLAPPATIGVQELTTRRLVVGVPVDNARARFTLSPRRNGLMVQVREATARLAGGELALSEARWDSSAAANAVDLQVRGISLAELLTDWQVAGVSGIGTLSGTIPIRIEAGSVAIAGGRVDAEGPGFIKVDWGAARETLVGAGQQVELAVTALEDFHYSALSVGVDQPAGGALTLAVGLEGANPAVLKNHPFRFNVNLSGQLAPILEAVREGQRIGAGLLHSGIGPAK